MDLTRNLPAFERSASTNCAELLDIPSSAAAFLVGFLGTSVRDYSHSSNVPWIMHMFSKVKIPLHHYDDLFILLVSLPIVFGERAHHVTKGVESSLSVYTTISHVHWNVRHLNS